MKALSKARSLFRNLFQRAKREQELERELQAHLQLLIEEKTAAGMPRMEARRAALLEMEGMEQVKESVRDVRSGALLEQFWQDVKFGGRMLRKNPGFTIVAVLTLALGIGANTAIFSIVDGIMLRPLPFPEPERLMRAGLRAAGKADIDVMGVADFRAWRDQQRSFDAVAAFAGGGGEFSFAGEGEPRRISGVWVTADFFRTLGELPQLGRDFSREDEQAGAPAVVVLSQEFWQSQFGGAADVVGRSVVINGAPATVVGIARPGLRFPRNQPLDVWAARRMPAADGRPPYFLYAIGRLATGSSPEQAAAEMSVIAKTVDAQFPNTPPLTGAVMPLKESMVADVRPALWVLLGAVGFILLIAAANVANLLLARGRAREREISMRFALGAARGRILRQLLTESVLLSAIGGAVGGLLSFYLINSFRAVAPRLLPLTYLVELDLRVLAFTAVITVATGVLFGLMPALQTATTSSAALHGSGRTTAGGTRHWLGRSLVAGEFALSLMLMIGAALLLRSFDRLQSVDPGFDPSRLVVAQVSIPSGAYPRDTNIVAFWDELLRRVSSVPGIDSAAVTLSAPPDRLMLTNPFTAEGQSYDPSRPLQLAEEMTVSPDYFKTLGVPLLRGRTFDASDRNRANGVIIINRTLAERYFPGQDPVGKWIQTGDPNPSAPKELIIGVVGDVKYSGLGSEPVPQLYVPYTAGDWAYFSRSMHLVVRSAAPPEAVVAGIRRELQQLDAGIPLGRVATMEQMLGTSVAEQRFRTLAIAAFAGLALVLSCCGIYGVTAYMVAQRTREIGIRVALGATRRAILRLVIGQGFTMSVFGIVVGILGGFAVSRGVSSLLFGISPVDPISFAGTAVLLLGVGILATYIPARRATLVEPTIALRQE